MPEFFWDIEQGSEPWLRLRCGIATASDFKVVLRDGTDSKTRRKLLLEKAGEVLTGEPAPGYSNWFMENGKAREFEARDLYAEYEGVTLDRVGFIKNEIAGCSPDSLVGTDGGLEVKMMSPHLYLETTLRGNFPPAFKAQCQGNIWVAAREWWDLAVYWPNLPLWVKRIYRDQSYVNQLEIAVTQFNDEVAEIVERVRSGRQPPPFRDQLRASLALSEEQGA